MANKSDRFYYDNFVEAADLSCRGADYLIECLTNYDPSKIAEMLDKMHVFEHDADVRRHEMSVSLAKAFVTPIDREDLAELSQNIDEVIDSIEAVLQRFYVNNIGKVIPDALEFARKVSDCCVKMKEMLSELEHFRKSEKLHKLVIEINHTEEDCDRFYLSAAHRLHSYGMDALNLLAWREIFDFLENCADACEHVADSVERIVMKNT